jgi:hypothetical protein
MLPQEGHAQTRFIITIQGLPQSLGIISQYVSPILALHRDYESIL